MTDMRSDEAGDSYTSILRHQKAELKVKGSRFIAEAVPVADAEEAEDAIARVRKREHGASHHCTAYRVGAEGNVFRYNDAGEPGGTAGAPILRQIDGRGLTDTLVVVTRYFGGTKLGTGGLARAYGDAAAMVLDACECIRHVISRRVRVSFDYDDTSAAMLVVNRFDVEVVDSTYTSQTALLLAVPRSRVDSFVAAFTEALSGRGAVDADDDAALRTHR